MVFVANNFNMYLVFRTWWMVILWWWFFFVNKICQKGVNNEKLNRMPPVELDQEKGKRATGNVLVESAHWEQIVDQNFSCKRVNSFIRTLLLYSTLATLSFVLSSLSDFTSDCLQGLSPEALIPHFIRQLMGWSPSSSFSTIFIITMKRQLLIKLKTFDGYWDDHNDGLILLLFLVHDMVIIIITFKSNQARKTTPLQPLWVHLNKLIQSNKTYYEKACKFVYKREVMQLQPVQLQTS